MSLTIDTKLGTLLDNPQARFVLDRLVPGRSTDSQTSWGHELTIRAVTRYSAGVVTEERVLEVEAALARLAASIQATVVMLTRSRSPF